MPAGRDAHRTRPSSSDQVRARVVHQRTQNSPTMAMSGTPTVSQREGWPPSRVPTETVHENAATSTSKIVAGQLIAWPWRAFQASNTTTNGSIRVTKLAAMPDGANRSRTAWVMAIVHKKRRGSPLGEALP